MEMHRILSLEQADVFFAEQGAVGFFDSNFPVTEFTDKPRIFRRHYFALDDGYLGNFIPNLCNMGTHVSLQFYPEREAKWENHPGLTRLLKELI